jgi:hypothetical protein
VGGTTGRSKSNGNAQSIADAAGPVIARRLAAENIHTLEQWVALGRRRYTIFGVTPRMVREIDELAAVRP